MLCNFVNGLIFAAKLKSQSLPFWPFYLFGRASPIERMGRSEWCSAVLSQQ